MAGRRRGQIIPRGPGKFLIRVPRTGPDGKPNPWSKTVTGTKRDAEKALTAALRALDEGRLEDPSRMLLEEWLSQWLTMIRPDLRERSWEGYKRLFRLYVAPALGSFRLADLKPVHVQKALTDLSAGVYSAGRPLRPGSVRVALGRLRQALHAAVKLRLIPSNPAVEATPPKAARRGPRRVLSPDEAGRFAAAASEDRAGALLLLSLSTGVRPGEALGLRWEDVDFEAGLLRVRHSLTWVRGGHGAWTLDPPKTASSIRDLPLPLDLAAVLRRHRARQNEERLRAGALWQDAGFVFTGQDGKPMTESGATAALRRVLRAAGLERMSRHNLRHSAATLLILAGQDPRHVAQQLGHSSVVTTLADYVKPNEDRLREGADLLAAVVFRRPPREARGT